LNGKEIMKNDDLLEIIKTDDIIEVSNIKDEKYIIKDEEKEKDSEDIGKKRVKMREIIY
jgi:hypothetical protein